MNINNTVFFAVQRLRPGAKYRMTANSYEGIVWEDTEQEKPTEVEVNAGVVIILAERQAMEYQRLRKPEYPSLGDFADAIYWAQKGNNVLLTQWIANCDAVKIKYPKPQ